MAVGKAITKLGESALFRSRHNEKQDTILGRMSILPEMEDIRPIEACSAHEV
jgi:hypothetical protein